MKDSHSPRREAPGSPPAPRPNRNILLAALALLVGVFVVFSLLRAPETAPNSAVPTPSQLVPAPAQTPGTPTATPTASDAQTKPVPLVIFALNDDALLDRKTPTAMLPPARTELKTDAPARASWLASSGATALSALLQDTPSDWPKGTLLRTVKVENNTFQVDFNGAFNQPGAWQGSALVTGVTQSIAWTLDGVRRGLSKAIATEIAPMNVQITVEGKPLELLGELEIGSKITPDEDALTAQAKAKLDS